MALKSVYLPDPTIEDGKIVVTDEEHRHLVVARAESGEHLAVFDGKGRVWDCVVTDVAKRQTSLRVETERVLPAPRVGLTLGLALIRTSPFELALEKAVEVGVTHIIPFLAGRSNVAKAERHERWQRIVIEAAKQSKHFHLPKLESPRAFEDLLTIPATSRIMLAERDGVPLKSALLGPPVLFLVGPEGGWTDVELRSAEGAGFKLVSLGSEILRAETAAIVGASLIRYELGDF
jgi:16S rRNA (uracil1498-N3)-methyltransferase